MSAEEESTRPLGEVCVLRGRGRCLPVEAGPTGALWVAGVVTAWQGVLDSAAAIRRLGDYDVGKRTGLYEVVAGGDRTVRRYLVAE